MAKFAVFRIMFNLFEFIENFRAGSAWFAFGHVFGTFSSRPPVFLSVVVENSTSLHTDPGGVFFRDKLNFFSGDVLLGKELLPDLSGLAVFGEVVFLIS